MAEDIQEEVRRTFPSIGDIADRELRDRVARVWADAFMASDHPSLGAVPFSPGRDEELGEPNLVKHVRAVAVLSSATAAAVEDVFDAEVDHDAVIAGSLVHDVSKVVEYNPRVVYRKGDEPPTTDIRKLVQHPHYAVYLTEVAGFSTEIQHIVLAHSPTTNVSPMTIEADIVTRCDQIAVNALYLERVGTIRTDE